MLLTTPLCEFGKKIKYFSLISTDDEIVELKNYTGSNGTLITFICNHCPYVKAVIKKIVETSQLLKNYQINSIAIMPNDIQKYPDDNFENMKIFSKNHKFNFPYLLDEQQLVAKDYEAVCTPEFFGYNKFNELQYRGRLTKLLNLKPTPTSKNDLLEAMILISKTNNGPKRQFPSMGCSIKWK